jgi:hypothetical protein
LNDNAQKKISINAIDIDEGTIVWSKSMACLDTECSIFASEAILSGTSIYNLIGVEDAAMLTIHGESDGEVSGTRKWFSGTSSSTSVPVLAFDKNDNYLYILLQKVGSDAGFYFLKYLTTDDTLNTYTYTPLNSCTPHKLVYNSIKNEIAFATKG